ncbi:MAG: hypothetical protein Tsb0017_12800 [Geothermobacteraceae bacterium]
MVGMRQGLSLLLILFLVLPPVPVSGAPVPDAGGPAVTRSASGIPVVQINRPNGAGVSHNLFRRYNVDREGLVLNNARTLARTDLAGWIQGNPNLGHGSARLIVNEVTGTDPSLLRGFTEIAGDRAGLVLANPNGMTCDGCGFINTGRVSLTTGRPLWDDRGDLQGFEVRGGQIDLDGDGLAADSRVDLLARAVRVNAAVHADSLNLVTGANRVSYADLTTSPVAAAGDAPSFAVDVSELGGLYAGRIRLIGTEAGLGVRLSGDVAALSGDLELTADGDLLLGGQTESAGDTSLAGRKMDVTGDIWAGGRLNLTGTDLSNSGRLIGQSGLQLRAQSLDNSGTLAAGFAADGTLSGAADSSIQVQGTLVNSGNLAASGTVEAAANDLVNSGGRLAAQEIDLDVSGRFDNRDGLTVADSSAGISADSLRLRNGLLVSGETLSLAAGSIDGTGELLAGGLLRADIGGDWHVEADGLAGAGSMELTLGGHLDLRGQLLADDSLQLSAGSADLATSALLAGELIDLRTAADLVNSGRIEADELILSGTAIDNRAALVGDSLLLRADRLANGGSAALIGATADLRVEVGRLTNTDGATLFSGGDLAISGRDGAPAASVINEGSLLEADGTLQMDADRIRNRRATVDIVTEEVARRSRDLTLYPGFDEITAYHDCWMVGDSEECGTVVGPVHDDTTRTRTVPLTDVIEHRPGASFVRFYADLPVKGSRTDCWDDPEMGRQCVTRDVVEYQRQEVTAWYESFSSDATSATVTYYPGYSPNRYIHPGDAISKVVKAKGEPVVHHETRRKVTETTMRDRVTALSAEPLLIAGGDMILRIGDALVNNAGRVSAGGSLLVDGSLFTEGDVSHSRVVNRGYSLLETTRTETQSYLEWHDGCSLGERHCGNNELWWPWPTEEQSRQIGLVQGSVRAGDILSVFTGSLDNTPVSSSGAIINDLRQADAEVCTDAPLVVPDSGLFHPAPDPRARYLIESDPRFADYGAFLSSDWMLEQLGLDPQQTRKRLGDGFFEQRLVSRQLADRGGSQIADSGRERFLALMQAGVAAAESLDLRVGIGLTPAQTAALSGDILWLVEREVQLPDGRTEKALVPTLYLAQLRPDDLRADGSLLAADEVEVVALDEIRNAGAMVAGTRLRLEAGAIDNSGDLAGGDVALLARGDIHQRSGRISGDHVALAAGGTIDLATATERTERELDGTRLTQTRRGLQSALHATGDLELAAGEDIRVEDTSLSAGADLSLAAGGDLDLTAGQESTTWERTEAGYGYHKRQEELFASNLRAGGHVHLQAGGALKAEAAHITAGGDLGAVAGSGISIEAAATLDDERLDAEGDKKTVRRQQRRLQSHASDLNAGGDVTLVATGDNSDLRLTGSRTSAGPEGTLQLTASGDVILDAAREERLEYEYSRKRSSTLGSVTTRRSESFSEESSAIGSDLAANYVAIEAGNDVRMTGGAIAGSQGVQLIAGDNLRIAPVENQSSNFTYEKKTKSGILGGSGLSVTIGHSKKLDRLNNLSTWLSKPVIGSLAGDILLGAEKSAQLTSADLMAAGNINLKASTINIASGTGSGKTDEEHRFRQAGLTISVGNRAVNTVQSAWGHAERANAVRDEDPRLANLHTAQAGMDLVFARDDIKDVYKALKDGKLPKDLKLSVSLGASRSDYTRTSRYSQPYDSSLVAGEETALTATGIHGKGTLDVTGSRISADRVRIASTDHMLLQSAVATTSEESHGKSSGGSIGITVGLTGETKGVTVNASGQVGRNRGNGESVTHHNTVVEGTRSVSLVSGADLDLQGAQIRGESLTVTTGGDLNIRSQQDLDNYHFSDRSASAGVSVPVQGGGASAQVAFSSMKVDSDFQSVRQQTGLFAGEGGFDVTVGGRTDLTGGAIVSQAPAQDNRLTTQELVWRDLENHASYDADSWGVSLDTNMRHGKFGIGKELARQAMTTIVDGETQRSTTRAVISPAEVSLKKGSTEGLHRDAQTAHTSLTAYDGHEIERDLKLRKEEREAIFELASRDLTEAYRVMFQTRGKTYRVVCKEEPCTFDTKAFYKAVRERKEKLESTGMDSDEALALAFREIQGELKDQLDPNRELAPGLKNIQLVEVEPADIPKEDGVVIAVNGILNDEQRAGELAIQNEDVAPKGYIENEGVTKKDLYLLHYEKSHGLLSEWMIAGYEKHLAKSLGYTNYDYAYADLLEAQGKLKTTSLGHSRGTLVQRNALEILHSRGYKNSDLRIQTRGAPLSEDELARMPKLVGSNQKIDNQAMPNDAIANLVGGQPGDKTASFLESGRMAVSESSAHSCYGTGAIGCKSVSTIFSYEDIGKTPEELNKIRRQRAAERAAQQVRTAISYRSTTP